MGVSVAVSVAVGSGVSLGGAIAVVVGEGVAIRVGDDEGVGVSVGGASTLTALPIFKRPPSWPVKVMELKASRFVAFSVSKWVIVTGE